jgi:hypothetical protein
VKHQALFVAALAFAAACSDDAGRITAPDALSAQLGSSGLVRVTNSNDDGPGSFRAAVAEANADESVRRIQVHPNAGTVMLQTPVEFTGAQDLEISGQGLVLDGSDLLDDETNFLASGGGDLEISGVTFQNAPGNGMTVQVPDVATGTQRVSLFQVAALGNDDHGVEINDQEAPEDAGDPDASPQIRPNSAGSDASLEVLVRHSTFKDNGFGAVDKDGLRLNEGGDGRLRVVIEHTVADDNGADGIELDERGAGDVELDVRHSQIRRNGDADQSAMPDKDDGIDVDELDEGDLIARVSHTASNDNFEEGFDFNENDAGDMRVEMKNVEASRNPEEGIDLEEDDDFRGGGSMFATLENVRADGNTTSDGDGGIKIRERADGDINAVIRNAVANGNTAAGIHIREQEDGDLNADVKGTTTLDNGDEGVFLQEEDGGNLTASVTNALSSDNGEDGIRFEENNDGDLTVAVTNSTAADNGDAGIRADQNDAGAGTLTQTNVTLTGNAVPNDGNVPPS